MPKATVAMPGSCGELVQGMLDGIIFHVTCPVDIYSSVTVELDETDSRLDVPRERPKAEMALRQALKRLSANGTGARMTIDSPLPLSKGMASSTADVAAAVEAAFRASGLEPAASLVCEIALGIEPTDGTFLPGIVAFDHRAGKMLVPLGMPPPVDIIVLDCGGEVDTIAFNSCDRHDILKRGETKIREALAAVREGIAKGDPSLIGLGASVSAEANQNVLFKPQLEKARKLAHDVGAVGVNVGHSGTVIGILLDGRKSDTKAAAAYVKQRLEGLQLLFITSLTGGGARVPGFPLPCLGNRKGLPLRE